MTSTPTHTGQSHGVESTWVMEVHAQQQRAQGVDMAPRELTSLRWNREPQPGGMAMT